jgi:sodium transport system permease protein
MNWRKVWIIFRKEFLDIIRDRRTLISMVLLPIAIIPLLMLGVGSMMSSQIEKLEKRNSPVILLNSRWAPELLEVLQDTPGLQIIHSIQDTSTAFAMLQDRTVMAVIRVPDGFEGRLTAERELADSLQVRIEYDMSNQESQMALSKVKDALNAYRQQVVQRQLTRMNLSPYLIEPFSIQTENRASEAQMTGAALGMFLPYLVIILAMTGCTYPAIDLTAGEKERGTMETLLVSPASRLDLVLGKFLTTMLAGFITAVLTIFSMTITLVSGASMFSDEMQGAGFSLSLNPIAFLMVFLLFVPLVALFASLLIAIAINARSYKEAQSYVYPLLILVIVPALTSMMPGVEAQTRMALIPVVNVSLILRDTLMGIYNPALIALTFLTSIAYAGIGIFISFRVFQKETVLLRT